MPTRPSWPTPWGRGRPGWHVECTAIAGTRLGPTIDLQGGGNDLIFPHHEYSAAHAEVLYDVDRFARHYTHAGMIGLDGEKMSKSRGNLVLVSSLRAAGEDPAAIRLALLAGHYRDDRMWTDELLDAARQRLVQWRTAARVGEPSTGGADRLTTPADFATVDALRAALADDLDTPRALAIVDRWAASRVVADSVVPNAVDALLGVPLS